ncbi:MAG: nucleotidyltransferase family protein [Myxococcota bacterium]
MRVTAAMEELVVRPDATIRQGMEALNRSGLEVALVCDPAGKLTGVVTDGDIRRALLGGAGLDASIQVAANPTFTAVGPDVKRSEAVQIMFRSGFKCLPVVDGEGHLLDLHTLWVAMLSQESPSWAVVMAGGKGTRLGELTQAIPKPMVPVGDRPILERIIQLLVSHGIRRIFLSVNYLSDMIEDHFGDGERFYCRIAYLRESEPWGTAGALRLLPGRPTHPVVVMNGDLLTNIHLGRLLAFHASGGFAATMALRRHVMHIPFGVARVENSRVHDIAEKPELTYDINAGIYALSPAALDLIPPEGPVPMTALLQRCLDEGREVGAYPMHESWHDIGLPEQLDRAQRAPE